MDLERYTIESDLERYTIESIIDDVAIVMPDGERIPFDNAELDKTPPREPVIEYMKNLSSVRICLKENSGEDIVYRTSPVWDQFYLFGDCLYLSHADEDGFADTVLVWDQIPEADISDLRNMSKKSSLDFGLDIIGDDGCEEYDTLKECILRWKSL